MRMIINSDDLGISSKVNECILGLMDARRVTSATLMVNAPAAEEAVRRMGNYKHCSFGVHLNLTQFGPLSSHPGLAPLLGEKGEFRGIAQHGAGDQPLTRELREAIFAEWSAQIESAIAMGVPVSHIDSHHHVHTRTGMLGILKRIQERFGIRKVRLRRNLASASAPMALARHVVNDAWNFALRHLVNATTTDGFVAFAIFHERLLAGKRFEGTLEVMCHPGGEAFAAETELLRGDWMERYGREIQLISYDDLEKSV